jgi:hypothetical protein
MAGAQRLRGDLEVSGLEAEVLLDNEHADLVELGWMGSTEVLNSLPFDTWRRDRVRSLFRACPATSCSS